MNQQVFDIAGSLDRVDGDKELLCELIDIFFEEFDSQKAILVSAVSQLDLKQVESCAHAMKSALGNIGASKAFEQAYLVEKMGKQQESTGLSEQVGALFAHIEEFKLLARNFQSEKSGS